MRRIESEWSAANTLAPLGRFGKSCISLGLRSLLCTLLSVVMLVGCPPGAKNPAVEKQASQPPAEPTVAATEPTDPAPTVTPATDETHVAPSSSGATPPGTNRLATETSPYLRLHMHNPVDWYPWGAEAFAKAKREGKLIFLSVGYSSCYWCHVMERESFMDQEIAAFLNQHFVCIKVDREERPDVDAIYMMAVQVVSGRGGWPMSVFLTPDAQPFFGGTYFPARDGDRPGAPGFLTVLNKVQQLWTDDQPKVRTTADKLSELIRENMRGEPIAADTPLDFSLIERVRTELAVSFDEQYGGFGFSPDDPERPKFPEASRLWFLLDCAARQQDDVAKRQLTRTLDQMAMGGLWDHVGGGFHRYCVDRYWQIPHFEKMLYDNGQLLSVYSRAYRLTGDTEYQRVVAGIVAFLQREMKAEGGAYFAAIDAESEQIEGKYYRWQREEVRQALGADESLYAAIYGLEGPPNFEEHYYVPQRVKAWDELASAQNLEAAALIERLNPLNARLLAVRSQRVRPLTDEKILCSWNGLVIRGLADAGRLCDEPQYTAAAAQAAEFILNHLRGPDGRLLRTFSAGQAKLNAYLDDYAFFIDGLLALHEATGESRWLELADGLMTQQLEQYWDQENGGFFFTAKDHEPLLVRNKPMTDEAQPSGNSVSAANLLYLSRHVQRPEYRQHAEQTVRNLLPMAARYAPAAPRMVTVMAEMQPE